MAFFSLALAIKDSLLCPGESETPDLYLHLTEVVDQHPASGSYGQT